MYKVREQRQGLRLLLVSLVAIFGLVKSFPIQEMVLKDKNIISEISMRSTAPSITFGSITSLYHVLVVEYKNKLEKLFMHGRIASQNAKEQDELIVDQEEEDKIAQEKSFAYNFHRLQKIIALSFMLLGFVPVTASQTSSESRTTTCLQDFEQNACGVVNRAPHIYALGVGLCANAWAAGIVRYSANEPTACAAACALSATCGFAEGILVNPNHQEHLRGYSAGYPADQICVPASGCYRGDSIANAAALGTPGYFIGHTAGIITKKYCCTQHQNVQDRNLTSTTCPDRLPTQSMVMDRSLPLSLENLERHDVLLAKIKEESIQDKKSIKKSKSLSSLKNLEFPFRR